MLDLTIAMLHQESAEFSAIESNYADKSLYGVTDGKAIGTYLEHKFKQHLLAKKYNFIMGNTANGIDFPELLVDMKVTSIIQPQSSCPFKSARQKIYGLGYALLIFVYEKVDNQADQTAKLQILHTIFVAAECTADFQMTRGILQLLEHDGNKDDLIAFMLDKNLPVDDIEVEKIADEIMSHPPTQGFLTISNALQWRLHYRRIIEQAGKINGIYRITP